MGTRIPTVFLIALFHTTSVGAQQNQCLELVRLSRMKTQTIMSQSQFASTVNAYCEERSNSSSAAVSAGGAGYSASASRAEASYGKFCSRDTDDRGSESDYNEYMEGVQPGAYAAFAACEAARNNDGVQFEMSKAPTRDRLVLGIFNRTNTGDTADMQWDGSDPVTCQWAGDAGGTPRRTLQPNERAFLECRRSTFDSEPLREPDAVDVFRADGGDAAVLNIPWPKYGPDNSPVQTLEEIRQQIDTEVARLQNEVNALGARTRELEQERPADYDSGWFDVEMNCRTYMREIGFDELPTGMMAYYKIGQGQDERIFPWGLNQYGDTNQSNGVLLDFDGYGRLYVRLPCGARLGNNVLHVGRYRTRDGQANAVYMNQEDVEFRVLLWR